MSDEITKLSEYRFNKAILILPIAVELFFIFIFLISLSGKKPNSDLVLFIILTLALTLLLIKWLFSIRVKISSDSISYLSIFSSRKIKFEEIEEFYYQCIKRSLNYVPLGTYYKIKLIDENRNKICFGNRINNVRQIGDKLINITFPVVYKKAVNILNNDDALQFGPIYLDNEKIIIDKLFGTKEIPLKYISNFTLKEGELYIIGNQFKFYHPIPIKKIPNVFVLVELFNTLKKYNKIQI